MKETNWYPKRFKTLSDLVDGCWSVVLMLSVVEAILCFLAISIGASSGPPQLILSAAVALLFIGIQLVAGKMACLAMKVFVDIAKCVWDIRERTERE